MGFDLERMTARVAAETTKDEWKRALEVDEEMLAKYKGYARRLQRGEKVENLTAEGAKDVVKGLEEVIRNKKGLLRRMA